MNHNKTAVLSWITSGMNYNEGIILLTRLSGKQNFAGIFQGKEAVLKDKLAYEICKAAGVADHITWKRFIHDAKAGHAEIAPLKPPNSDAPWSVLNPLGEYPPIIHRVLHESASLFQQRSRLHRQMVDLPESNTPDLVSKRAALFTQVKSLSERLGLLYDTKLTFLEKGIIPDERQLYPDVTPGVENESQLKKRKKNLQTSNSKDLSRLDDSLPASPRRLLLESRVKDRCKLIEEIDYQLINLRK